MKIVSLNIWGGRVGKNKVLAFFRDHKNVDIFCLQEVWSAPYDHMEGTTAGGTPIENDKAMTNGLQDISEALPEHTPFFYPLFGDDYGILMMVANKYVVTDSGADCMYMHKGYVSETDPGDHVRMLQYVTIETEMGPLTVLNFHGLWSPKPEASGKKDIPERIEQSQKIVSFLKQFNHPVVLAGDFNLRPDTESVKILEAAGLKNLIPAYNVTSTRTSFYEKPEKYADYIFVSTEVEVQNFSVLPEEISDHAALQVDIDTDKLE